MKKTVEEIKVPKPRTKLPVRSVHQLILETRKTAVKKMDKQINGEIVARVAKEAMPKEKNYEIEVAIDGYVEVAIDEAVKELDDIWCSRGIDEAAIEVKITAMPGNWQLPMLIGKIIEAAMFHEPIDFEIKREACGGDFTVIWAMP